ncbi:GNAT family N-acetyltransferase [Halorarius halobius]|uniref:GNAT family N-acetyltransferase n=1 Tax=Halorarius halobius TaxID=2962671 RepID=UPI0020CE5A5C|nr:GNAT family N-acetyltransferase [Halorarius halobius]
MNVDTADLDDADALADLWVDLATGQRDHGSHLLAAQNREQARESLLRHALTGGLLVAREDGDVLGFVSFYPEGGSFEQDVQRGIVENIYVVPERRGEGIGSTLLEAAEEELIADGVEVLALEAMADNERARRFYRRHGYEPHRVELERETDTRDGG